MSVLEEIDVERGRQSSKGYDAKHDDAQLPGTLADTGQAVLSQVVFDLDDVSHDESVSDHILAKHTTDRARLIIVAALIVAEIERMDRLGLDKL